MTLHFLYSDFSFLSQSLFQDDLWFNNCILKSVFKTHPITQEPGSWMLLEHIMEATYRLLLSIGPFSLSFHAPHLLLTPLLICLFPNNLLSSLSFYIMKAEFKDTNINIGIWGSVSHLLGLLPESQTSCHSVFVYQ